LGYTKLVYKYNDESEDEDEFPSKIGGSPVIKIYNYFRFGLTNQKLYQMFNVQNVVKKWFFFYNYSLR